MKGTVILTLPLLFLFLLTSCEVFKTTPRSSPNYRGPGSANRNSGTYQNSKSPQRSASNRPAARNNTRRRPDQSARSPATARRTPARATTSSPRTSASPPKKELASRPSGAYVTAVPKVVQVARTYTGTPYRSGGNDKEGIDCSGLICQVYSEIGVRVPRISWQQSEFGREVEQIDEIKPGDWLFFVPEGGKEGYVSHSGIVTEVRGNRDIVFIHASSSRGVIEDNLFSNYFRNRFVKAVRPF
jgi:probable lipoprotein NlpC